MMDLRFAMALQAILKAIENEDPCRICGESFHVDDCPGVIVAQHTNYCCTRHRWGEWTKHASGPQTRVCSFCEDYESGPDTDKEGDDHQAPT